MNQKYVQLASILQGPLTCIDILQTPLTIDSTAEATSGCGSSLSCLASVAGSFGDTAGHAADDLAAGGTGEVSFCGCSSSDWLFSIFGSCLPAACTNLACVYKWGGYC